MVGFTGGTVLVFGPDGELIKEMGEDVLSFSGPYGLALGPSGELWISTWSKAVLLLDADGNEVGQWGKNTDAEGPRPAGVFKNTDAIAVDAEGNVYVGDGGGAHGYLTKFVYQ
jgi:streptogramin lyase